MKEFFASIHFKIGLIELGFLLLNAVILILLFGPLDDPFWKILIYQLSLVYSFKSYHTVRKWLQEREFVKNFLTDRNT